MDYLRVPIQFWMSLVNGDSVLIETPLKHTVGNDNSWTFTSPTGLGFTIKPISTQQVEIKVPTECGQQISLNGMRVLTKHSEHLFYEMKDEHI